MITWDEPKRQANIKQHGSDFAGCEPIFDYPMMTVEDRREAYGEQRLQSLGFLNGRVVFVVWVDHQDATHLISVREATKHESARISKSFPTEADIEKAIAVAPERVIDPECPYDPNDPKAVAAFWEKGEVRRPGQRGPQRRPTKVSTTLRLSPEVVAYFKAQGRGWQTRIDEALKEWVAEHFGNKAE